MKPVESSLQRLLRSAAQVPDDAAASVPFGFDTRVVALWRASRNGNAITFVRLVRKVALMAAVVLTASGVASFRRLRTAQDLIELISGVQDLADDLGEN